MPDDTQPPAPEHDGGQGEGRQNEEIAAPGSPAGAPAAFPEGQAGLGPRQGQYGAGPNPYAARPGPYGAGPNPHGTGPAPYGAGPNPYGAGPAPYGPGPNPYGASVPAHAFGAGPYGTAYPGQPAPARPGTARIHAVWLAITVLVAIITGSSAYYLGTHHVQRPPPLPPAAASQNPVVAQPPTNAYQCEPTDTAAGSDSRLISELLPVPAGASRPPTAPAPRAYTLHAYVSDLYARSALDHEEALLEARCFQTAVNGQWQTAGGTIVSIWLVQFADSGGARSYALGQEQTDLSLMGRHGRWADVSGVLDGMLIQDSGLDQYGDSFTRMFGDRGNIMILIHVDVPGQPDSEDSMTALLRAQADRIGP
jgi:hypothetical protein